MISVTCGFPDRRPGLARRIAGCATLALAVAILALGSGCGFVRDRIAGGADNTLPPAELERFEELVAVREVWRRNVGSGPERDFLSLVPAVAGDRVYAADRRGTVRAFAAGDGRELWRRDTRVPASAGPGLGEGLVLLGTSDGQVVALGGADGTERWRARVTSEVLSPPQAADGLVVVRTVDGKLFGLDAQAGEVRWIYDRTVPVLSLRGTSTPVLTEGAVIAGFDSGRLVAVSLREGQTLWESRIAIPAGRSELERMVDIDGDPVIVDDTIYVAAYRGRVAALVLYTGDARWDRELSSHAGLGVDGRAVYVTDEMSHVWALERGSGASMWKQDRLEGRRLTAPVPVGEQWLVVGDFEGHLHWLRRDDGQLAARTRVDRRGIIVPPVADGDVVYVYGSGGTLTALRPASR
jgi:outer membrane protein assembly factor BamB